jgi:hypothetical protein
VLIETLCPLIVGFPERDLRHEYRTPVELPEEQGSRLLAKVPDKVRVIDSVIVSAAPEAQCVYWQKADTSIWGLATPLFFERSDQDYVLVVEYRGELISVNAKMLRSKAAFETQVEPRVVTLIKDNKCI